MAGRLLTCRRLGESSRRLARRLTGRALSSHQSSDEAEQPFGYGA
jgi:hypothetical protein